MNLSDEIDDLLGEGAFGPEKPVHLIFSSKEKALLFKKSINKNDVRGKTSVRKTKGWKTHSLVFKPHSYADVVAIMKMYKPEKGSYKDIARDMSEADTSSLAYEIESLLERESGSVSFAKLTSEWRRQSADMLMFTTKLRMVVNNLRKTPGYEGKGRPGLAELEQGATHLTEAIKSIGDGIKKMSKTTFFEGESDSESELVESESAIKQAFAYEVRPWLINQLEVVLKGLDREVLMMKKGKWPKPRMEYGITRYRPMSMVQEDFMTQVIREYRDWRGDLTSAMGKR